MQSPADRALQELFLKFRIVEDGVVDEFAFVAA